MAGSKTAYLSQKLLDHVLGGAAYTPPTKLWVALSTQPFTATATGTSMGEIAVSGYARLELTNTVAATWTAATAAAQSEKHNKIDLVFPAATANNPWGTPASAYLVDALTGGNALYGADITNGETINAGDNARIPANAFVFVED